MNWLEWLAGIAGTGGVITAAAMLGILPALVTATMAFIRGVIDIVLDLLGCPSGRIVLLALAAALSVGYCFHWEYMRGYASCHSAAHPISQPPALGWREIF